MSYRGNRYNDGPMSKVYVGDLGSDASEKELEDAFGYYGAIKNVWIAQNPPGFAFVEFEDSKDAEDAIKGLDGSTICGRRAKVEMARGRRRGGGGGGFGGRGRGGYGGRGGGGGFRRGGGYGGGGGGYGGGGGDDRCYECGGRGHFARDCRGGGDGYRRRSRSRS